jgi:hypothetical protein
MGKRRDEGKTEKRTHDRKMSMASDENDVVSLLSTPYSVIIQMSRLID